MSLRGIGTEPSILEDQRSKVEKLYDSKGRRDRILIWERERKESMREDV